MSLGNKKNRLPISPGVLHLGTSSEDTSYLVGSRCRSCGRTYFPKRPICCFCMKDDKMEEAPLSTKGKIDTFSVVQVAPMGFKAPYIQAFVDLPEGPRIFSLITGCEPSEEAIKEGEDVELVVDKIREDEKGNELIGYKFRPMRKKS